MRILKYIIACLYLSCFFVTAQPVLTAVDFGTNISAKIHTFYGPVNLPNYNTTGSNHVWDFSSMSTEGVSSEIISVPLNIITNIDSFPDATYCEKTKTGSNENYVLYTVTSNSYKKLAGSLNQNGTILGSSNYDVYFLNTTELSGEYEPLFYNGYGTLITPYETFSNVIALYRSYFDPFGGGFTYRYVWIATNPYRYIMRITNGFISSYEYYEYIPYVLNIDAIEKKSISIYPNPTSNNITISSLDFLNKEALVNVYDVLGNVVISNRYINNDENTINLENLSSGIYFLKITNQSGNLLQTQKIIKQ